MRLPYALDSFQIGKILGFCRCSAKKNHAIWNFIHCTSSYLETALAKKMLDALSEFSRSVNHEQLERLRTPSALPTKEGHESCLIGKTVIIPDACT